MFGIFMRLKNKKRLTILSGVLFFKPPAIFEREEYSAFPSPDPAKIKPPRVRAGKNHAFCRGGSLNSRKSEIFLAQGRVEQP
jgi:hypothetical protein